MTGRLRSIRSMAARLRGPASALALVGLGCLFLAAPSLNARGENARRPVHPGELIPLHPFCEDAGTFIRNPSPLAAGFGGCPLDPWTEDRTARFSAWMGEESPCRRKSSPPPFVPAEQIFSLDKLVKTIHVINKIVIPRSPFDPEGGWVLQYDAYSLHESGGSFGTVEITKSMLDPHHACIEVDIVRKGSNPYSQFTHAELTVRRDALSTPVSWTYSKKLALYENGPGFFFTGVDHSAQILRNQVLRIETPKLAMEYPPRNGVLCGFAIDRDPRLAFKVEGSGGLSLAAADYPKLFIRLYLDRGLPQGCECTVEFSKFGKWYGLDFPAHGGWHEYWIDLTDHPNWNGIVQGLRLDLVKDLPCPYLVQVDRVTLKGDLDQLTWDMEDQSAFSTSGMACEIQHHYVDKWALFDVVQRLPRWDFGMIPLNLIKDFDNPVGPQVLRYRNSVSTVLNGQPVELHGYERVGESVLPCVYWVDELGRCLFVISGMEAYICK